MLSSQESRDFSHERFNTESQMNTTHRNKGYTTQAAKGLIKYLFENTNVQELIAIAQTRNQPSNKVLQKCGFEPQDDIEIENREYHVYKLRKSVKI
ncbi:GNAT family N-acetyltransferase [Paenibacillus azoreducens]|uniref:N-acetyltransferase domain-containing protein n=1 Tax=Paenibacillus azoreducens TaxID=116718 RepID=A0A919YB18_9BACL|nr:GNAT family N-acetyltransferase [Paenibacillus azoreducens]GIO45262.1 hypothetical protein J34TS1_00270 [Paenibacillus azoreducens]